MEKSNEVWADGCQQTSNNIPWFRIRQKICNLVYNFCLQLPKTSGLEYKPVWTPLPYFIIHENWIISVSLNTSLLKLYLSVLVETLLFFLIKVDSEPSQVSHLYIPLESIRTAHTWIPVHCFKNAWDDTSRKGILQVFEQDFNKFQWYYCH